MKLLPVLALSLLTLFAAPSYAAGPPKVVYHVNSSEHATSILGNIRNHLVASPKAKIVVVTHGHGIDFLIEGAKNATGNPYDIPVQQLTDKGVEFRVCNNSLVGAKIDPSKLLPDTKVVPSGVAEVARLQADEGYVYLKP